MPLPALLLAALPALLGGGAALAGGAMQNAAAKRRSQEQMDFQERMSSTSYQRAMEDMKQSGLNPMLAYNQGGASSPGGAMPQTENILGPAVSSALAAQRGAQEYKMMKLAYDRDKATLEDDKKVRRETARTAFWHSEGAMKQSELLDLDLDAARLANAHSAASLPGAQFQGRMDASKLGKAGMVVDRLRDTLLPFLMLGRQGGPMGRPFGMRGSSIRGRY